MSDEQDPRKDFINKSYSITEQYTEHHSCSHSQRFGLCHTCVCFRFAETEFKVVFARCSYFRSDVRDNEPIKKCSEYEEKGRMDLADMGQIAYMIEKKKNNIGFCNEDD